MPVSFNISVERSVEKAGQSRVEIASAEAPVNTHGFSQIRQEPYITWPVTPSVTSDGSTQSENRAADRRPFFNTERPKIMTDYRKRYVRPRRLNPPKDRWGHDDNYPYETVRTNFPDDEPKPATHARKRLPITDAKLTLNPRLTPHGHPIVSVYDYEPEGWTEQMRQHDEAMQSRTPTPRVRKRL